MSVLKLELTKLPTYFCRFHLFGVWYGTLRIARDSSRPNFPTSFSTLCRCSYSQIPSRNNWFPCFTLKEAKGGKSVETLVKGVQMPMIREQMMKVTFKEAEAAKKACADPTPVIDGRRANCNLASLGAHRGSRPSPPPHRYMKESSSILVIGLSIHTAPVEMREKLAIPEAEWPWAIGELCNLNHIEGGAVLCTCNRMEIYVSALAWHGAIREVTVWMSKTSGINIGELCEHLFILQDNDAIQHLFQVSSGLDSLVLGEGQILSQTKQVYKAGQGVVGFGKNIGGLFKHAITAGMRVRADTSIAAGAVSVSSAAVELAIMKLSKDAISHANMLVIGAGKMGRLVIKHLIAKGCKRIVVVNRTQGRVSLLREEMTDAEIIYRPLDEMFSSAAEADVVFTSTASETPLFLREHVEALPSARPEIGGFRFFIDIAVPRNVGTCVSGVEFTNVFNVDDLKEVVAANKEDRLRKAQEAQVILDEELRLFEAWRDSLKTVPTIKKLRAFAERVRFSELEKCSSKWGQELTKKEKKLLDDLSRGIVNKLLHGPMQHLRCDGSDSSTLSETLENMYALERMFNLAADFSALEQKIKAKVEQSEK